MITPLYEGNCVRHTGDKFVGLHAGFTRLDSLMERTGDLRAVRVQLPDGSIKIASEHNLEKVGVAEYSAFATTLGVVLKGGKLPAAGR
jgi:hypothetical protein